MKSWLKVTQCHSNWYHSKAWVGFLFAFHSNYGSILHHFRDEARYWLKIVIFHTPMYSTLPLRGSPAQYYHPVWCGKTRMMGLPEGEKTLRIYITVYTEYWRVMDGRTDGHLATAQSALCIRVAW